MALVVAEKGPGSPVAQPNEHLNLVGPRHLQEASCREECCHGKIRGGEEDVMCKKEGEISPDYGADAWLRRTDARDPSLLTCVFLEHTSTAAHMQALRPGPLPSSLIARAMKYGRTYAPRPLDLIVIQLQLSKP